jgi:anti-sigma-K factor RskA
MTTTYFAVNNTGDEAFAITLEPAGGSLNPGTIIYLRKV